LSSACSARQSHELKIVKDESQAAEDRPAVPRVIFTTPKLSVDLRTLISGDAEEQTGDADPAGVTAPQSQEKSASDGPTVDWHALNLREQGHKGLGVFAEFEVLQGEVVDFIFREIPCEEEKEEEAHKGENGAIKVTKEKARELGVDVRTLAKGVSKLRPDSDPVCTPSLVSSLIQVRRLRTPTSPYVPGLRSPLAVLQRTNTYWKNWIGSAKYKGRWREVGASRVRRLDASTRIPCA
jgi:hypothetical protein